MKTSRRLALGIDFGGTGIKIGLVDESGRLLESLAYVTAEVARRDRWFAMVAEALKKLTPPGRKLCGIGVGVPGFTDFQRGFIHNLTNVPGWSRVPLAALLRRRFGLPAWVENDVNAMAAGECAYGAGRGYRQAVFATLGTGVGGAVVIDGELYRGAYSMAGEIGHMCIDRHGPHTPEGWGGLETYVGNQRLVAYTLRRLRQHKRSLILKLAKGDSKEVSIRLIAQAAARRDPLALEVFDYMADCLATAFAAVTYLLQPEAIIVGGGIAQSGRVLFQPLRRHLARRLHPVFAKRIKVVPAQLGPQAGMVGCAALAFRNA